MKEPLRKTKSVGVDKGKDNVLSREKDKNTIILKKEMDSSSDLFFLS